MLFSRMANLGSDGLPFAAFYFAAVIPWNFFAFILMQSSISLTNNYNLLAQSLFSRLILPLKSVVVGAVDLVMASSLILATMAYYGRWPDWTSLAASFPGTGTADGTGVWAVDRGPHRLFSRSGQLLPYCCRCGFS